MPADSALDLLVRPPLGWAIAAVWGALWGSFFNVCIHRLGLYESVTRPRSRCPSCGAQIGAVDNIPVLSWLVLGGRCRRCRAPISARYPLVEAGSALLAVAVYARFVAGEDGDVVRLAARFFLYFAFGGVLLVLSGIDLDHMLIPDVVTYPAIPLFFVAALFIGDVAPLDLLRGAVGGYLLVAAAAELGMVFLDRPGMGYGDAKLLALVGALLGRWGVLYTFFLAPFAGLVVLVPLRLWQRRRLRQVEVPYGPFLAVAAMAYLFFGQRLLALLP